MFFVLFFKNYISFCGYAILRQRTSVIKNQSVVLKSFKKTYHSHYKRYIKCITNTGQTINLLYFFRKCLRQILAYFVKEVINVRLTTCPIFLILNLLAFIVRINVITWLNVRVLYFKILFAVNCYSSKCKFVILWYCSTLSEF